MAGQAPGVVFERAVSCAVLLFLVWGKQNRQPKNSWFVFTETRGVAQIQKAFGFAVGVELKTSRISVAYATKVFAI